MAEQESLLRDSSRTICIMSESIGLLVPCCGARAPTLLSYRRCIWRDRTDVQRASRVAASPSFFESKYSLCVVLIDLNGERDE
jgi:hypothetical protein